MLAAGQAYPYSCKPEDVWEALQRNRVGFFFVDVQARGYYPSYALKEMERKGIMPKMERGDEEILRQYPVELHFILLLLNKCSQH